MIRTPLNFVFLVFQTTKISRRETEKVLSLFTANLTVSQSILSLFSSRSRSWMDNQRYKNEVSYQEQTLVARKIVWAAYDRNKNERNQA